MERAVSIYIRKPKFAGQKGKFTLFVVYMETGNLNWGWCGEGEEEDKNIGLKWRKRNRVKQRRERVERR